MASAPDFNSPDKDSAYWGFVDPVSGKRTVERTQGYSFIQRLQKALKLAFTMGGRLPTYPYSDTVGKVIQEATIDTARMGPTGKWDPITNRVLGAWAYKLAKKIGATDQELNELMDDLSQVEDEGKINDRALGVAILAAYHTDADPHTDPITLFDETTMPPWNQSPPSDALQDRSNMEIIPVTSSFQDTVASMPDYASSGIAVKPSDKPEMVEKRMLWIAGGVALVGGIAAGYAIKSMME